MDSKPFVWLPWNQCSRRQRSVRFLKSYKTDPQMRRPITTTCVLMNLQRVYKLCTKTMKHVQQGWCRHLQWKCQQNICLDLLVYLNGKNKAGNAEEKLSGKRFLATCFSHLNRLLETKNLVPGIPSKLSQMTAENHQNSLIGFQTKNWYSKNWGST